MELNRLQVLPQSVMNLWQQYKTHKIPNPKQNLNGSLTHGASVWPKWKPNPLPWIFGFKMRIWVSRLGFWVWSGREEWIRYGFTQRKKSRGCVCDGGSVRGSSEAEWFIKQIYIYIYILQSCYSIYCSLIAKIIGFKSFDVVWFLTFWC